MVLHLFFTFLQKMKKQKLFNGYHQYRKKEGDVNYVHKEDHAELQNEVPVCKSKFLNEDFLQG